MTIPNAAVGSSTDYPDDAYLRAVRIAEAAMPEWVAVPPAPELRAPLPIPAPTQRVRIVSRAVDVSALRRKYFGTIDLDAPAQLTLRNEGLIVHLAPRNASEPNAESRCVVVSNGRVSAVSG